jgi:Domain of unknown function (DUF1929)
MEVHSVGRWLSEYPDSQVLAVHAALLHTGKIIFFGGDEYVRQEWCDHQTNNTRLFDCDTHQVILTDSPHFDAFCSGHALLSDGRFVVAGGTGNYDGFVNCLTDVHADNVHPHFTGLRDTAIYDPITETWREADQMNAEPYALNNRGGGRWYPTLITLMNGQILAMSGHPSGTDRRIADRRIASLGYLHINDSPEKFSQHPSPNGSWSFVPINPPVPMSIDDRHLVPYYPRLHVLPGGDIFSSSPRIRLRYDEHDNTLRYDESGNERFDATSGQWTSVNNNMHRQVGDDNSIYWDYGGDRFVNAFTSVLLPLSPDDNYRPRVLICGGRSAFIIDPTAQDAEWHRTAPRNLTIHEAPPLLNCQHHDPVELPMRINLNAIILPTGEIFICGGVYDGNGSDCSGVMPAELYDPQNDRWTTLAPARVVRNYHSVAILMPDGRIWTAGSSKNAGAGRRREDRETTIEIYEPWYIGLDRPRITSCDHEVDYGGILKINTTQADFIRRIAVIHPGSVTHAYNSDQRYIGLRFEYRHDDFIVATGPPANAAVPGYYLLFVINKGGVPSNGEFIRIKPSRQLPQKPTKWDILYYLVDPPQELPDPVISLLTTIEGINEPLSLNKAEVLQQISKMREKITDLFKTNKIDKTVYDNLVGAISQYTNSLEKS